MERRLTQFERGEERSRLASGQLKAVHHVRICKRAAHAVVARLRIELSDSGWSMLGFHIGVGFQIGASIVLPIQAVYLDTSDSHFAMSKWSSDNV